VDEQAPAANSAHTHHHAVQFYGNDVSLYKTVAGFLSEGLVASQPALIVATGTHTTGILNALADRLIDVDRACRQGDLVILDAKEALAVFMTGDIPDPEAFATNIG
jgi:hypothetical protein